MGRRTGMTLIELLVAIFVTVLIAGASTIAISRTLDAGAVSAAREKLRSRADLAARSMASDLGSIIRDGDLYDVRVLVVDGDAGGTPADELLVFTQSATPARSTAATGRSEGAAYEVQYRLAGTGEGAGGPPRWRPGDGPGILWRRIDPVPDEVSDGGGVVHPVVEGLESVSIEAFDGEDWQAEWDSDRDGVPHAVRVIVRVRGDDGREAVARRVVSMDRVPLPYVYLAPDDRTDESEDGGGAS